MDVLAHLGKEPHFSALANIGGVLGLISFSFPIWRWLASYRRRLSGSFRDRRIELAQSAAKEFRLAVRAKAVGMTNAFIIESELRRLIGEAKWTVFYGFALILDMVMFANSPITIPTAVIVGFYVTMTTLSVRKITYLANRALTKIAYSELPTHYWRDFKRRELKKIRRQWLPRND